ncbi:MAG: hypothetical protein JJT87_17715 [Halomonas sp.]|nr:hypothetical protein [Halomonas sp.]MCC5903756.1 hypothetical protein [Halomonas sp.]
MSFSGYLEGDIYSHCWFYESARRSFEHEGYGETCGGITAISLTAFMVESYLNLCCKLIFDVQSRVSKVLDHPPSDFLKLIDQTPKGIDIHDRVSIAYGYKEQLEKLTNALEAKVSGRKKDDFIRFRAEKSFYEIDDSIRFSPRAKFDALTEALYEDECIEKEHRELIGELFKLRNSLAHGRSELVKSSFTVVRDTHSNFSSDLVPVLQASWQEKCSQKNAYKLFNDSCEVIKFLSNSAFGNKYPFRMPTQVGTFTQG